MRRTLPTILVLLLVAVPMMVFAGGDAEEEAPIKQIRVAGQIPGLITPGVWDGQTFEMNSAMYEYLVEINTESGALDPVLATSWETDTGKVWTFKLREGVSFHDGSDFTAEDVKFTLERTQDPGLGHLKKADFEVMESVRVVDDHTLEVTLKEPRPTFVYQLTDYNMAILSSEYDYASLGESKPMGTGPYVLSQYIPKESVVMDKNPNYWAEGLPKIDRIGPFAVLSG